MKTTITTLTLAFAAVLTSPAAVVLTNDSGTTSSTQIVRGLGGFLSQPFSYGFDFTVGGPYDVILQSVGFTFSNSTVSSPIVLELFASPSGPNSATLIATMSGPPTPAAGSHTWTAPSSTILLSGATYFFKLSVPSGSSSYTVDRTAEPITGPWTYGSAYTKVSNLAWVAASGDAPKFTINAIPEPSAALLTLGSSLLLMGRKRVGHTPRI